MTPHLEAIKLLNVRKAKLMSDQAHHESELRAIKISIKGLDEAIKLLDSPPESASQAQPGKSCAKPANSDSRE